MWYWLIGILVYLLIGFILSALVCSGLSGGRSVRWRLFPECTIFLGIALFWPILLVIVGILFVIRTFLS